MAEGHYDITGPEGTSILPRYWDIVVKPDMEVKVTVRGPEPIRPSVHSVRPERNGKSGLTRSKSSKGKRRSWSGVMFSEIPPDIHGPAPPPLPLPPLGAQLPDDIVYVEDDDFNEESIVKTKKPKKQAKQEIKLGMFDVLFSRPGGKKSRK